MPKAEITKTKDVTSKFRDVNEYDRIYQTEHGYHAKIRTVQRPSDPGILCFEITGSWVDDKTGKARVVDDLTFIVTHHEVTVRSESPTDLVQAIEDGRVLMAERVDLAAANHVAMKAMAGVKKV